MIDVSVVVYLDNILIYSNNLVDHRKHVKEVLRRLRKNGLYAHANKCEFHSERVEYLRYILSPEGLSMDQAKVKVIQDWPEPQKVKDVQSFLGFANFYRRFIFNYSDMWSPSLVLPVRGSLINSPRRPAKPSTYSKKHSPLPRYLLTGSRTDRSSSKLMPRTMPSRQSSPSPPKMVISTLSLSILDHSRHQS